MPPGTRSLCSLLAVLLLVLFAAVPLRIAAQSATLDEVRQRGVLRVGTTGDYAPFSWVLPDGTFEGFDIDAARSFASTLGVSVQFVHTTWPTLMADLEAGRFDVAMSGITRTAARLERAALSSGYLAIGKVPLARRADGARFQTFADIDRPGVRIGVNPGGTNEAFVRSHTTRATVVVIADNRTIPDAVARGVVDVMITDDVEARLAIGRLPTLTIVEPDRRLTQETLAYLMPKRDPAWVALVDDWLSTFRTSGGLASVERRWLPR